MAKSREGRYPQISDGQLVMNALLGDIEAFDELAVRYRAAITVVALQAIGSRETAEDLAQETLLLAFKALAQLQEPDRFGAWICSIARHRAYRVGRQESRHEPTEESRLDALILRHSPALAACPEQAALRSSEQADLRERLAELEPEFRLVLQLRYFEEWPLARIADFLSIPLSSVKWRLRRGRELLRRRLSIEEENQHGTSGSQSAGDSPHPPPAARDRSARGARQPDRQPGQGQPNRHSPVQSYP